MTQCLTYAPVYGQKTTDLSPAFDGGARSNVQFPGNLFFGFEVTRASVGVYVGLNEEFQTGTGQDIDHGFYFTRGKYYISENRVLVGPSGIGYFEGDRFYIMRLGSTVLYLQRPYDADPEDTYTNAAFPGKPLPGNVLWVSEKPSFGTVFLSVSMYSAGDIIQCETAGVAWGAAGGTTDELEPSVDQDAAHLTMEIPFVLAMADTVDSDGAYATLELPFAMGTEDQPSISPAEGAALELPFSLLSADIALDTRMVGELPFTVVADASGTEFFPTLSGVLAPLQFEVEGGMSSHLGSIEGELPFTVVAVDDNLTGAVGYGELSFYSSGLITPVLDNFLQIFLSFSAFDGPGDESVEITEGILAADDIPRPVYVLNITDPIYIQSVLQTFFTVTLEVTDAVATAAVVQATVAVRVAETLAAADSVTLVQAVRLADELVATGEVQTFYQAVATITSALVTLDAVIHAESTTVQDAAGVEATLEGVIQLLALLTDSVGVEATLQNVLTIIIEESAEFTAEDSLELDAQYFQSLIDRVEVLAFIKTPAELAQGWVMNTEEGMPLSEYDNYTFNSLAYGGDEMLGCNDQGLYVLDGADDDGTDIDAAIASLMLDFDTSKLKRMSTAYIGYKSDGHLLLRVRSVDQGEFVEHWYEGRNTAAQTPPGQNRMKIGKGLRSRYWVFELVNIEGSDFELDKVELYPIVLQRRI